MEKIFEMLPMKAEKEITNCNILKVRVGTTGYCGGDTGHGGRTYFSLEDLGCTDMTVFVNGKYYNQPVLEIVLGGDTELETFIDALTFAAESLKVMSKE